MEKVHFIASNDKNGLNSGVFFIRVHPWSLNFIIRALSYYYFYENRESRYIDQYAIRSVLIKQNEKDHYIIVPQYWFNNYIETLNHGDFILHFAGKVNKDNDSKLFRENMKNETKWYSKTSKEMREEVLKYYNLPKSEQIKLN